jgi:integrase
LSKPARRPGSINLYYRESIPADIRKLLIQRGEHAPDEVWVTLGTPDFRLAKAKLVQVQADQHRKWDAMREAAKPIGVVPGFADLIEPVAKFVHDQFEEVHRRNLSDAMRDGLDLAGEAKRRREKIVQVDLLPTAEDRAQMELIARVLCRDEGWDLGPSEGVRGERWNELVGLVTKAVQLARGRVADILEGRPVSHDRETVVAHLGGKRRPKAKAGETILELFDLYEAESLRGGKSADTLSTERKVIGHFASFVGKDRHVCDIGRADIREFKKALARVPHRWTTKSELKEMSLAEAAAHWEKLGGKGRSIRTVDSNLSAVSSLFVWLIKNAYYEGGNPTRDFFDGVKDKNKTKYPPYTNEQLRGVFGSPLFASCQPEKPHSAGTSRVRDWRYWLPLCALYSGARAGEIAQLLCADIRQEQGVWVFDFNEEGHEGKSLKNRSSRRIVPIHPALLMLGLCEHVSKVREAGHTQLFPEIKPGPRGDWSYRPSKFWQKYLKNIGIKVRGLGLHSFRHGFVDECRRGDVSKDVVQGLLGHSDGSMTGHYGSIPWGTLLKRKEAIEALSYGGLHADPATPTDAALQAA